MTNDELTCCICGATYHEANDHDSTDCLNIVIPQLREKSDECTRLRKALDFYADEKHWHVVTDNDMAFIGGPAVDDNGEIAREALRGKG